MKAKCIQLIQIRLIESNEIQVHTNKAKLIQIKLIESNESQVHSNKTN